MSQQKNSSLIDSYQQHIQEYSTAKHKPKLQQDSSLILARNLVGGSPDQYYGSSFVSTKLIKDSRSTYYIALVANSINVLTSTPALYFGFSSLSFFGPLLTAAIATGILKVSNDSASAASASAKGNRPWSSQGLMLFIGINILLSAISGIGSEIMVNRSGLKQEFAKELLDQKMSAKPLDMSLYQAEVEDCEGRKEKYEMYEEGDPRRTAPYFDAHGFNADGSPKVCDFVQQKRTEAQKKAEAELAPAAKLLEGRSQFGNDLLFLEENFPVTYEAHFDKGDFASGSEVFRLAFESFFGKLQKGDYTDMGSMGFSFFMFSLSVVTSAGACLMMVAHVYRKDTALSHNPYVRTAMTEHLAYLDRVILDDGDHSGTVAPTGPNPTSQGSNIFDFPTPASKRNAETPSSSEPSQPFSQASSQSSSQASNQPSSTERKSSSQKSRQYRPSHRSDDQR